MVARDNSRAGAEFDVRLLCLRLGLDWTTPPDAANVCHRTSSARSGQHALQEKKA